MLENEFGMATAEVLNVAGSRGSKEPGVAAFVKQALEDAFCPSSVTWQGGAGEG